MPFLVNTPDADRFMQLAMTETGCKAFLGDADEFDAAVAPDIANSNVTLRRSAEKIFALTGDPTRGEVARHEAAQQLAEQTIAQLAKAKAAILSRGQSLQEQGLTQADLLFEPDPRRGSIDSETRAWIKDAVKKPTGIAKVRNLANEDRRFATVLHHSPPYLMGIEPTLHSTMQMEVLLKHFPDTYAKIHNGIMLQNLAPKYDKAMGSVRTSFYNGTIAAQASRRVAV